MQHHPSVNRLRAEFLEMPGLRLTKEQINRFCGIESGCSEVLETLVREHFLCVKPDGRYARVSDGRHRGGPYAGYIDDPRLPS